MEIKLFELEFNKQAQLVDENQWFEIREHLMDNQYTEVLVFAH